MCYWGCETCEEIDTFFACIAIGVTGKKNYFGELDLRLMFLMLACFWGVAFFCCFIWWLFHCVYDMWLGFDFYAWLVLMEGLLSCFAWEKSLYVKSVV